MVFLFLATFTSEDLACISAGVLIANGRLTYLMGVAPCFLGIFAGDILAFLLGRLFGSSSRAARWMAPEKIGRARHWLEQRGAWAVFVSRFTPGLRVATYFTAGLLEMEWWKFVMSLGAATAIWVPLLISSTTLLGAKVLQNILNTFAGGVLAAGLAFLGLLILRKTIPVSLRYFRQT